MKYNKPEINALGDAASVIQDTSKIPVAAFDAVDTQFDLQPAYDLDE